MEGIHIGDDLVVADGRYAETSQSRFDSVVLMPGLRAEVL